MALKLNYDVFMAEVDNVGYKRTKRGEKEMPNELFTIEYAPLKLDVVAIDKDYNKRINDMQEAIGKEVAKKSKEKKADKIAQIEDKIKAFESSKSDIEKEYSDIKAFISKYYNGETLKEEYIERTDDILIGEFKNGRLQAYRSEYVALHENTYMTILDYMRDIEWE